MNIGYLASSIIAGIFLISLVALNLRVTRSSGEQTLYNMAKIQADLAVELATHDLRATGYGVLGTFPIQEADSNHIRFLVHFEGDEDPTEIEWKFDTEGTTSHANPSIRPLYRIVDGDQMAIGSGITQFDMEYIDANRQVIEPDPATISQIRQVRLELTAESTEGYGDGRYGRSLRTTEITLLNLH